MLPLKKIYIDSRDRTVDSKSASNFRIELPNTVQMPENTVSFVTDVCVPHVWKAVEEGFNDSLFLSYIVPGVGGSLIEQFRVVVLEEGNYTLLELATQLQTKLNAISEPSDVSKNALQCFERSQEPNTHGEHHG